MEEGITVAEAAKRAGVSVAWIRRLCAAERIDGAKKIGRDWVIPSGVKISPAELRASRMTEIPRAGKKEGKR